MTGESAANILYTDTDVNGRAIRMARRINPEIRIIAADEVGMRYASDAEHFAYAIEHGYVLVTGNTKHYRPLITAWRRDRNDHPGIVFITPESSRRSSFVAEMFDIIAVVEMTNREEWI